MSTNFINVFKSARGASVFICCALAISACGGGSEQTAGIGGTGITAKGVVQGEVTGFGSIFVNGKKFEIDSSNFIVDGSSFVGQAGQAELALGMVVRLSVKTENGVFTDQAIEVVYDDEVQGPVSGLAALQPGETQRSFSVFGESITIDDTGTRFAGTSFADIKVGDIVEISGFRATLPDRIVATYVRKTGDLALDSEVELRGIIENYSAGLPETFEINGFQIEVDPAAQIEVDPGTLQDDLFVEVEGKIQSLVPLRILAMQIESEDEDFGDEVDDVRLQGIISEYDDALKRFEIAGQVVTFSDEDIEPLGAVLGNGVEVEVEGDIVGGILVADEVEVEAEESELRSFVGTILGSNSFTVDFPLTTGASTEVIVNVDAQTVFEDDKDSGAIMSDPFSLDDLVGGGLTDYVIVKGEEIGDQINATLVKRVDAEADEKRELDGIVDGYKAGDFIEVLGIRYELNGLTQYEPDSDIMKGDFVELEDKDDPPDYFIDGIADEIERE